MTVSLDVEPGFAMDFLSILEVKSDQIRKPENYQKYKDCLESIDRQLGDVLVTKILKSKEYKKLYEANEAVYLAINKIMLKEVDMSGEELSKLNSSRTKRKAELQKKFFGMDLKEEKNY